MTENTWTIDLVSIADVNARREWYLSTYFAPPERERLRDKPVQTIAGRVALKRALCRLTATLSLSVDLSPCDVVIERREDGAPQINGFANVASTRFAEILEALSVSISHSKTTAAGLALLTDRSLP